MISLWFFLPADGTTLTSYETGNATAVSVQSIKVTLGVSLPVYIIGLASFIGWFGFTIFSGIGLVALPLDLILWVLEIASLICSRTLKADFDLDAS